MLYEFLINNREELARRCRDKVARRPNRSASSDQLQNGVPMFLDQLIRTLQSEHRQNQVKSLCISGAAGGATTFSEVGASAAQHGKDLLDMGFTVSEVVHDYGDLCQAITDLAVERDAPFLVDEFRTLNRCLDNAIADAVTEFSYQQNIAVANRSAKASNEHAGFFAHELRNFLGTASLAFAATKAGNLSLTGATGSILERSLNGLSRLIDESLEDIRAVGQRTINPSLFSVNEFIVELAAAAQLAAQAKGCILHITDVESTLALSANRELIFSAVANLLQNAIKFTRLNTTIKFTAYASGEKINIDVADQCGGLPNNAEKTMFLPFEQNSGNRSGLGLGLAIAQQSINASGGTLTVRNIPTVGCVFTVSLPRFSMPT